MSGRGAAERGRAGAIAVGSGIFISRIFGLVRQRVVSHFLGVGDAADVLGAALRIPNFLQNLLGEGVLSASFVPVYARLRAEGRDDDAARLARALFGALALVCAVAVVLGEAAAPWLVTLIAGGFDAAKRDVAVLLVRILFPGTALLVLSAWCLGVLNAHRRYFISYTSPVAWNLAIIGALLTATRPDEGRAAVLVAVGASVGGLLQFAVQVPWVLQVLGRHRAAPPLPRTATWRTPELARVASNFWPVLLGRGAVQVSAWVDILIASNVMNGAVAVLNYAQNIALLPVSLFGMSLSASELTEMATQSGAGVEQAIRDRMSASLGAVAYFVVPSSAAFVLLGDVAAGAVLQTGRFDRAATVWVWAVLAGSAVGLVAGTMGRLYNSAWYALHDTRTPVRIALVRIALTAILGAVAALWLPDAAHFDRRWGVAALTASAGCAAWIEFLLLRRALDARIGPTRIRAGTMPRLWGAALVAAAAGWGVRLAVAGWSPLPLGGVVFAAFATAYFGTTLMMGIPEAAGVRRRIAARLAGNAGRR